MWYLVMFKVCSHTYLYFSMNVSDFYLNLEKGCLLFHFQNKNVNKFTFFHDFIVSHKADYL